MLVLFFLFQSPAAPAKRQRATGNESVPRENGNRRVEDLAVDARKSVVVISQMGRSARSSGIGSGFVISADGLIATCLHVIGEGRSITVRFADGHEAEVEAVHAWDRKQDLAILKVKANRLSPLPLGNSDELVQGNSVVAMGSPQGMDHSVVQGIVSARRTFDQMDLIQIAIPIEPGNSGGPLLDMRGRVEGLLTMKSALTPNLGFAVPVNALKSLLAKPNPVSMERWLALTGVDPAEWHPQMGAQWSQRGSRVVVRGAGDGFGGRSICIFHKEAPAEPFEVSVQVRLEDESGAAGLIFGADDADHHFGFYPTAGRLRLTRFEGPNVFSWTILQEVRTPYYRPGEWNEITVRVEGGKGSCAVNGHRVIEFAAESLPGRLVGLAKFRDTVAEFRKFHVDRPAVLTIEKPAGSHSLEEVFQRLAGTDPLNSEWLRELRGAPGAGRVLEDRARELDRQAARFRQAANGLHRQRVVDEVVRLLQGGEEDIDLGRATLLVAQLDNPDLDIAEYLQQLDRLGRTLQSEIPPRANPLEKARRIREFLRENGFHGSRTDYYNKANSYLNELIDDREGLPITLSVLYLELARRVGLRQVDGVPLPERFMVRVNATAGKEVYFDLFEGGDELSIGQLNERYLRDQGYSLQTEFLKPALKKEIIVRMLRNLLNIASQEGNVDGALGYLEMILALNPNSAADRLQRGLLRAQAGEPAGAKEDLAWILEHKPEGVDLQRVEELMRSL